MYYYPAIDDFIAINIYRCTLCYFLLFTLYVYSEHSTQWDRLDNRLEIWTRNKGHDHNVSL